MIGLDDDAEVTGAVEIDGELILLSTETGQYYCLDELGTLIYKQLKAGVAIDDIAKHITAVYEVDFGVAKADVLALHAALRKSGCLA